MAHTRLKLLSAIMATIISTGASLTAMAEPADHKFEVQFGAGRLFFEEPRDDANLGYFGLGLPLNKSWTLELIGSGYSTEQIGIDLDGTHVRLDALYNIDTTSKWRPFVAFGIGEQRLEEENFGSVRDTLVNLGAGLKRDLGNNWEFRTDIRAFNSLDEEYTDLAINAGFAYKFGVVKPAPVVVAPPAPAPEPVKELDSDGDGVFDSKDQCPDTPRQYKVDAVGCPMELTETVAVKLAIRFDYDKAIVKDEYLDEVGNLAKFMNQYLNTVVTVEGHTDSAGTDAYNKALSQRRADSVKSVLITKYGVEAERVKAVGYGEEKPIADNKTAEGREENRRVVGSVSTDVTKKVKR